MTNRNRGAGSNESSGIIKRAAALFDRFQIGQTHGHFIVPIRNRTVKTVDSLIDSLYRVATAPMTDRQLEIIENKLLNLANEDDAEAARQFADLYLCRMKWERTRSAEDRQ